MAKRRRKALKKEMRAQIKGILLLALAVFAFIGLLSPAQTGGFGLFLNNMLRSLAGEAAIVIPVFIAVLALRTFLPANRNRLKNRLIGMLLLPLIYMTYLHLQLLNERYSGASGFAFFIESLTVGLGREGGGVLGAITATSLHLAIGPLGGKIFLAALTLIALLLVFDISLKKVISKIINAFEVVFKQLGRAGQAFLAMVGRGGAAAAGKIRKMAESRAEEYKGESLENEASLEEQLRIPENETGAEFINGSRERESKEIYSSADEATASDKQDEADDSSAAAITLKDIEPPVVTVKRDQEKYDYIFPPLDLLSKPRKSEEEQVKTSRERAKLLESTLLSFGVKARVVHVQSGPTVTRFEVQPEAGVKVSKISSLSDDLALNLAAPLVRIEAPIPGKAALGIEVPNQNISPVCLREVMEDKTFQMSNSPLTIALGKDITGNTVIADLTKMPHLLIAGATGAGKSVCLNTIINSILYKAGPEQVRFMMVDPKVVELSIYNGVPHLLMPVVTDPRKASLALRNMVREMGRRYDLFAKLGVRDISAYNELPAEDDQLEQLSYIVVIIDELADLMLVSPGEVEDSIARLAQMSRAAGIHLLVATQRPSVDVLTGIIKANITSRIAFTVSSQFDSRTILDMAGAEKLLGRGDMLFYPVGAVKPFRVQGAYVSEVEVKKVTDFIKEQGQTDYQDSSVFLEAAEESEDEEADALFAEAVDLVVRTGQASISLLQRRFRIGYTRAARLIDDLERRGVVGPFEGSKPREVLVTDEQAEVICREFKEQQD